MCNEDFCRRRDNSRKLLVYLPKTFGACYGEAITSFFDLTMY